MRRKVVATVVAFVMGVGLVLAGGVPATAATNPTNSITYQSQTFYVYTGAGELPYYSFEKRQTDPRRPVRITVTDPTGTVQQACEIPIAAANTTGYCTPEGLTPVPGVWTVDVDMLSPSTSTYIKYTVEARSVSGDTVSGRVWIEQDMIGQWGSDRFDYWIGTREGYLYHLEMPSINGVFWQLRANGFGYVEAGTCTPVYKSLQPIGGSASPPPGYEFGDACGDRYKLFLEEPDADLPAEAPSARGTEWVRPAVIAPSASNLRNIPDNPFTRAGQLTFDLAGVNGGYTVQIDADHNGSYGDPVDRTIPWGSPPGAIAVPFDGRNGLGEPISVCQPVGARVVVDRVGEMHFSLTDVEVLSRGLRITGLTPGVVAPNPKVYWDDREIVAGAGQTTFPSADGRAGVDTSTLPAGQGTHGWASWGDTRLIENWSYYQAQAGAQVTLPADCDPALELDKSGQLHDANGNGLADVGEQIEYAFTVRNTGNAPVTDVAVSDGRVSGLTPESADLAVLGEQVFSADPYTVTQADIDAGGVANVAAASGIDPFGADVISNEDSHFVPTPVRDPKLALDKRAVLRDGNGNGLADEGETIDYSFEVENTGNTTLTDVTIADARVEGVSPATAVLAPGERATFTAAAYTVSQADVRVGAVHNTAVAGARSSTGPVQSNTDSTATPTPLPAPALELTKTGVISDDVDGDGSADQGDVITYTFRVDNPGNVDVTSVSIDDPRVASVQPAEADIPAGGFAEFTATYVTTQADVDAGEVPNTARAEGRYLDGDGQPQPIESAPDSVVIATPERAPALVIEKGGVLTDANGNGTADAGERIDYTFTVTNTGNTTLEGVEVLDDRVDTIAPASATLAPQEVRVFVAAGYVVTQADVDEGEVRNVAFARGHVPGGAEVYSPEDEHVEAVAAAAPALAIDKRGTLEDANDNGTADAGETIAYEFAVANTGNVTLRDVTVVDDRIAGLLPESIAFLPPTRSFTFLADRYEVTEADVEAGKIVNVATATGDAPDGQRVASHEDRVSVDTTRPLEPTPPLEPAPRPEEPTPPFEPEAGDPQLAPPTDPKEPRPAPTVPEQAQPETASDLAATGGWHTTSLATLALVLIALGGTAVTRARRRGAGA